MSRRHIETFRQAPYQGLPEHWVVSYDDEEGRQASYFNSEKEAYDFEEELTNDQN